MTDKEKLIHYLQEKGISKNKFYEKTGLSVGFLNSGSSLGVDKLRIIKNYYPDLNINWLVCDEGHMIEDAGVTYWTKHDSGRLFNTTAEDWLPVYTEAVLQDPGLQSGNPEAPGLYLPKAAFPGCDYGERAFGNSMFPLIVNQALVIGKLIDLENVVYGEVYGLHLKKGPPVVKYVLQSDQEGSLRLGSENKQVEPQDISVKQVVRLFRVLYIINPA